MIASLCFNQALLKLLFLILQAKQLVFRTFMPGCCRPLQPLDGFLTILPDSLSLQIFDTYTILGFGITVITAPMLAAAFATIHVQKLKRSDYGFVLGSMRLLPIQVGVMLVGIPLGFLEYAILTPEPWIADVTLGTVIVGVLVIMFGTGVSEELVFRGILLHNSSAVMGGRAAILYTTVIFTAMHIGFLSVADLVFVFFVGLFFAYVAYRTGTLLGVIGCHTVLNIMLFMVAPFVF